MASSKECCREIQSFKTAAWKNPAFSKSFKLEVLDLGTKAYNW